MNIRLLKPTEADIKKYSNMCCDGGDPFTILDYEDTTLGYVIFYKRLTDDIKYTFTYYIDSIYSDLPIEEHIILAALEKCKEFGFRNAHICCSASDTVVSTLLGKLGNIDVRSSSRDTTYFNIPLVEDGYSVVVNYKCKSLDSNLISDYMLELYKTKLEQAKIIYKLLAENYTKDYLINGMYMTTAELMKNCGYSFIHKSGLDFSLISKYEVEQVVDSFIEETRLFKTLKMHYTIHDLSTLLTKCITDITQVYELDDVDTISFAYFEETNTYVFTLNTSLTM